MERLQLRERDRREVLRGEWLSDTVMDAAQGLIQSALNDSAGFQSTILLQNQFQVWFHA